VADHREESHRIEAERQREARRVAEAASKAKSEFISRMSHEVRTPLNAVLGFAQLLKRSARDKLDATEQEQLDMVCAAAEHLRTLLDDVLDLSRIEAGEMLIARVPVELCDLIRKAMRMSEAQARSSGIRLIQGFDDLAPIWIEADPNRLRQVLLNIISNGIKYNRPGGMLSVDVAIELKPPGSIKPSRVQILIMDDGIGMTPWQVDSLFQPFNRLGRENSGVEGVGIGLVLARQLTELMGGQLVVASHESEGTVARISLPYTPPASADAAGGSTTGPTFNQAAAAALDTTRQPKGRVLYIEDNPVNAILVEQLLADWPEVTVQIAEDGLSGVRKAIEEPPDLVLLDMHLPDISGHQVLEMLKANEVTRGIAVVALSASALQEDVRAVLAAGALDYWIKPVDVEPFKRGVSRLLGGSATFRSG
jgi:nitrogen-specific signal transduction histidine kinase/CheY-like chemotaxis protein